MKKNTLLKYRTNYNIPEDYPLTYKMVEYHWNLEKKLALNLLKSNRLNRNEVFIEAYTTLYKEIYWLNIYDDPLNSGDPNITFERWISVIGISPKTIYEIGSGKGKLIEFLAKIGHQCIGTEITSERGVIKKKTNSNLDWHLTNGVDLLKYEKAESYDYILSSDVIEHLHPDDLFQHFETAQKLLKKEGKYIISTPHFFLGPSDISQVFNMSKAYGMHLKEYKVCELIKLLRKTGFSKIEFGTRAFTKKYHKLTFHLIKNELDWFCFIERILDFFPRPLRKMIIKNKHIFPLRNIFILAHK